MKQSSNKNAKKDLVERFSVSLPKNLFDKLDERLTKKGYSSRSEIIRDMIREKMIEDAWGESSNKKNVVAVLVIVYNHHEHEVNQKIIDLQHTAQHTDVEILCTTHVHINHNNCMESIFMNGKKDSIEQLSLSISGLKGVKFSKLTRAGSF